MPRPLNTIQRAFEMASSGQFDCLDDLRTALIREGRKDGRVQTEGQYVQGQLMRALNNARRAHGKQRKA